MSSSSVPPEYSFAKHAEGLIRTSYAEAEVNLYRPSPLCDFEKHYQSSGLGDKGKALLIFTHECCIHLSHLEHFQLLTAIRTQNNHHSTLAQCFHGTRRTIEGTLLLLTNGFDSVARQNMRPLYEMGLVVSRLMTDKKFLDETHKNKSPEEANSLWYKYVSKDKTRRYLQEVCAEKTLVNALLADEITGDAWRVLGLSAHPTALSFYFSFTRAWKTASGEESEVPSNFCLANLALIALATVNFSYQVISLDETYSPSAFTQLRHSKEGEAKDDRFSGYAFDVSTEEARKLSRATGIMFMLLVKLINRMSDAFDPVEHY